jgi:hypothetical protein
VTRHGVAISRARAPSGQSAGKRVRTAEEPLDDEGKRSIAVKTAMYHPIRCLRTCLAGTYGTAGPRCLNSAVDIDLIWLVAAPEATRNASHRSQVVASGFDSLLAQPSMLAGGRQATAFWLSHGFRSRVRT